MLKAKARSEVPKSTAPLARAEILDKPTRSRLLDELDGALKQRPANEEKLVGALRAVAVLSPALRASLAESVELLLKRGGTDRPLYSGALRAVAESGDKAIVPLLKVALANDDGGGTAALAASCFARGAKELAAPLAKLASSRQSHLSFGAETARVARGESTGMHLAGLAPMIKESHRISLCAELFVSLTRGAPVPAVIGPALTVLRSAERHLGRWLVLAEVAAKAGDPTPRDEARQRSDVGPQSARAAWALCAWALEDAVGARPAAPSVRPTVELIARLSDRPSADRDPTFLFRMARARAPLARPMLESLTGLGPTGAARAPGAEDGAPRAGTLDSEGAIRSALYLANDHGRGDLLAALELTATAATNEDLRGLAAAALWDLGPPGRTRAREIADDLVTSKTPGNVAWGALIRAAAARNGTEPLVTEAPYRWIQWGWLE